MLQSTLPKWVETAELVIDGKRVELQSTLPKWVETLGPGAAEFVTADASIHSTQMGRDPASGISTNFCIALQSTLPKWVETIEYVLLDYME